MSNDAGGFGPAAHRRRGIRPRLSAPQAIHRLVTRAIHPLATTRRPVTSGYGQPPRPVMSRLAIPARGYPPPGYPPPGYAPSASLATPRAIRRLAIPARLSGCAQAGRDPVAPSRPVRHLQRRRRLRANEPQGFTRPHHGHRDRGADPLALILQAGTVSATGGLAPPSASAGTRSRPRPGRIVAVRACERRHDRPVHDLLSGLLTVVVGRAVFGARITIGEAWQRVRGRLLALFGFTALEALGAIVLIAVVVGVVVGVAVAANGWAAFFVGAPLVLARSRHWPISAPC